MNLAQLRAATRDRLSAGKGTNAELAEDPWWGDGEVNGYLDDASRRTARAIRLARSDYYLTLMNSTDGVIRIGAENYNPSSLRLIADTTRYTLPPDVLGIKLIRPLSPATARFHSADMAKPEFRTYAQLDAGSDTDGEFLYRMIGRRTLVLAPIPQATINVELWYDRRIIPLREYSTGTITVTNGSATVTGVGTTWTTAICPGAELLPGTATTTPIADPNVLNAVIARVDSDTQLTLAAEWSDASAGGIKYVIADVPDIPLDYHWALVDYATGIGFAKGIGADGAASKRFLELYATRMTELTTDLELRALGDPEFVRAYLEDE